MKPIAYEVRPDRIERTKRGGISRRCIACRRDSQRKAAA